MTRFDRRLPSGHTVRFTHCRYAELFSGQRELMTMHEIRAAGYPVSPCGGVTIAEIRDADDKVVAQGRADCSKLDNFDKELGRNIALGRAVVKLEERELRDAGWVPAHEHSRWWFSGDGLTRLRREDAVRRVRELATA